MTEENKNEIKRQIFFACYENEARLQYTGPDKQESVRVELDPWKRESNEEIYMVSFWVGNNILSGMDSLTLDAATESVCKWFENGCSFPY